MGPIYRDIYRHLSDARWVAFEAYLRRRWDGPLALRNRNLSPEFVEQHRRVTLHDAARAIDVDQALLNRLAANEEIGERWWIDPMSFERWAACEIHTGFKSGETISVAHLAKFFLGSSKEARHLGIFG